MHRSRRCQPVSGSRALRPVSAGLDVQDGDRHGGAAQGCGPDARRRMQCVRLPDGRVGNFMQGLQPADSRRRAGLRCRTARWIWSTAIVVSCNAYFAQLGTYDVGAEPLFETANLLGIAAASPNTAAQLKKSLPQSSYGQGQVVASPFQMARVAATVAERRHDAAGPLGHRRDQRSRDGAGQAVLRAGCGRATLGKVHARSGDRRARAGARRERRCRWPARPARPNWRTRRRTPGSSASRPTGRGPQNRVLRPGGEWRVRRHGGGCRRRRRS